MRSYIVIAIIVAVLAFYTSFGNDSAWYKDAISVEVVPPYLAAYDALTNKIIKPLLMVDINELNNETVGQTLVNDLVKVLSCGVKTMQANLTEAYNDSQSIGTKLSAEITALVLSISLTENEMGVIQRNVASLEAQVGQVAEQARSSEQAVNDKQNAVNSANNGVAEAQRAVDRARECRGKRSFRFRRLVRRIIRPFCSILNSGGINRAKERRSLAERELNDARNRLNAYQQSLGNLRNVVSNLRNQISTANDRLTSLKNQLTRLREQQRIITTLHQELRQVVLKISTLFASSAVLGKIIHELTDFEALIVPLNGVYNSMNSNGFITGPSATVISSLISSETAVKVRSSLDQLRTKLASMPLNLDTVKAC